MYKSYALNYLISFNTSIILKIYITYHNELKAATNPLKCNVVNKNVIYII